MDEWTAHEEERGKVNKWNRKTLSYPRVTRVIFVDKWCFPVGEPDSKPLFTRKIAPHKDLKPLRLQDALRAVEHLLADEVKEALQNAQQKN